MLYSDGVNAEKLVGIIMRNGTVKHVTKGGSYIDRLIFVKIRAKPINLVSASIDANNR